MYAKLPWIIVVTAVAVVVVAVVVAFRFLFSVLLFFGATVRFDCLTTIRRLTGALSRKVQRKRKQHTYTRQRNEYL